MGVEAPAWQGARSAASFDRRALIVATLEKYVTAKREIAPAVEGHITTR
jgi:hypothetical protein